MLERAKAVTSGDGYQHIEYCRWADDIVILVDGYRKWNWLERGVYKRLCEELAKLDVKLNTEKTRIVDLAENETFTFLGFLFRRIKTRRGKWMISRTPRMEVRTKLMRKLKDIFRRHQSQPVDRIIHLVNQVLRGWVNYFRNGNSSRCFYYIRDWVEKKVRRHLMCARKRQGFGWERWSKDWLYNEIGLYSDYKIRYYQFPKASPAR